MCSCRAFPLVGIVEFIRYGCMKYFRERYTAASINISNPQIQLSGCFGAYPEFVSELDMLTPEDVVWEPYSPKAVATRAPAGLPSHCSANASLWLTTAVLVYDIAVEAYCPWRVRRQFGQRQGFPVPTALERVSRQDHR